jgi:tetratricopeptide (TPR) repeat protein
VAFSKDGTLIATGGGDFDHFPLPSVSERGKAIVWDARTGAALALLQGLKEPVNSVAFSPDGTRLVTAGARRRIHGGTELKVWDARKGTLLLDLTNKGKVSGMPLGEGGGSVAFSPDSRRFVTGGMYINSGPNEVKVWINKGPNEVKVWDPRTGTVKVELKRNKSPVLSVAFSKDGSRIVTGSADKTATIWDARRGTTLLELKGHTGNVFSVAFSPDGKRVVTGSGDRTVRVWDARTGTTLAELKGHTGAVTSVCFSADGTRILTADGGLIGGRGEVFVWDARTGKEPPDEEEIAYRRLHMEPNPSRYRAGYLAARAAKDEFAAAFYLNLIPSDERNGLVAQADVAAFAAMARLAYEYRSAGKLDQAVPLLVKVLNFNKAKLGLYNPTTIQTAETLGRIYYYDMGQFEKAIPLYEDVLKYRKAKYGPANPQTLGAMGMLGGAYKDAGRLKEAMAVLEEGAAKAAWLMRDLLDVYALAGEHRKVIDMSLKQLAEVRKSKPKDTSTQADLLGRLGRAYLAQKKWSDAELYLREWAAFWAKVPADNWTTFDAQSMLGASLLGQKKYADAEPLLLKGYEGLKEREKSLGPRDAPRLPEAIDRLIELYTATNKPDEAKKWRAERANYSKSAPQKK